VNPINPRLLTSFFETYLCGTLPCVRFSDWAWRRRCGFRLPIPCYRQPAQKWGDALPVGNGRLGAMVNGGIAKEHIQLNEDTIWNGKKRDRSPEARSDPDEIRVHGPATQWNYLLVGRCLGKLGNAAPADPAGLSFSMSRLPYWTTDKCRRN
jgi:hypothetical protein